MSLNKLKCGVHGIWPATRYSGPWCKWGFESGVTPTHGPRDMPHALKNSPQATITALLALGASRGSLGHAITGVGY